MIDEMVSRQGLFTTQTQNKTRQNYYAILPVYAGEAFVLVTDIHIYSLHGSDGAVSCRGTAAHW